MGIDLTNKYGATTNLIPSEWQAGLTYGVAQRFISELVKGNFSNYALSSFLQNDSEYVVSLDYYPIALESFLTLNYTSTTLLHLGKSIITWNYPSYNIPIAEGGHTLYNPTAVKFFSTTITAIYNNYLDYAPYTKIQLYVPFFPLIELDPKLIYGQTIDGYLSLDTHNGKLRVSIYNGTTLIHTDVVQIGIRLSIGANNQNEQTRNNILNGIQLAGSIASLAYGAYSGNGFAVAGGIKAGTQSIAGAINANVNRLSKYQGTTGDRTTLSVDKNIYIIKEYPKNPYLPDNALKGSPCNRTLALSSLSGYQEMEVISFKYDDDSDVYQNEVDEIINLLKNGVIM